MNIHEKYNVWDKKKGHWGSLIACLEKKKELRRLLKKKIRKLENTAIKLSNFKMDKKTWNPLKKNALVSMGSHVY